MRFRVKAIHPGEGIASLELEAASAEEACARVRDQGYAVLAVRAPLLARPAGRPARFPLVLFSTELVALLASGLGLVEALETLAEKEPRHEVRQIMNGVLTRLRGGETLSQALGAFPGAFPALYVATVQAAERTGDLPEALSRYLAYAAQLEAVRRKLVAASLYPALLLIVGGLVALFLLGYVVPRFSHIYENLGRDLPLLSRLLIGWGRLLEAHGMAAVAALATGVALLLHLFSRPGVRRRLGDWLWRHPWLGERLRIWQLARLYRTLGMLLAGGIPLVTALGMVEGLLAPALRARLAAATQAIREGQPLSAAFHAHGLTTPVALRLLRVGEKGGHMGEMLERIAAFHDEELGRTLEWGARLVEPLLMALMGGVIGLIVVLLYLPIFELAGSVS